MTLTIREGRVDDAEQMIHLLNPIILAGGLTAITQMLTIVEQENWLRAFPADGVLLVAEEGGRILGLQDVAPLGGGEGEISTFVALEAHRRGVGRALTEAMLPACRTKGIRNLKARIQPTNPTALAFYYAMDFRKVAGGHPAATLAERSTEVIEHTADQGSINAVLEKHWGGYMDAEREAKAVAAFGRPAYLAAKKIVDEAINLPIDWSKQDMNDGLDMVGRHLESKYPWLKPKARSAVGFAYMYTWK